MPQRFAKQSNVIEYRSMKCGVSELQWCAILNIWLNCHRIRCKYVMESRQWNVKCMCCDLMQFLTFGWISLHWSSLQCFLHYTVHCLAVIVISLKGGWAQRMGEGYWEKYQGGKKWGQPRWSDHCPTIVHYWVLLSTTDYHCPLLTTIVHYWLLLSTTDHYCPLLNKLRSHVQFNPKGWHHS